MAQRPTSDFDIDPNITSGTDLANILNRFQDAMDSGNSGASRPAYLAAGGMWVKEGNPMRLYLYDGTKDIELYNTTDGLVGGSQWIDNGNDIYYNAGYVGIGTDSLDYTLVVQGDKNVNANIFAAKDADGTRMMSVEQTSNGDGRAIVYNTSGDTKALIHANGSSYFNGGNVGIGDDNPTAVTSNATTLEIKGGVSTKGGAIKLNSSDESINSFIYPDATNGLSINMLTAHPMRFLTSGTERMRIAADGRVGIGGTPSRSAEEIAKEAKDTLARWKSTFDERLKAEPKADKKAITLEITDDEFSTFPTEETLVERLQERNIGGGGALLQVAGTGHFSGDLAVNGGHVLASGKSGILFQQNALQPINNVNGNSDAQVDIGLAGVRFKDGHFSGTVYANGSPLTRATDLIETLSTLREATRDETTLEGLRDALSDAIGGLIQKFEAQISTTES